jgi:choline transport protein
MQQEQETTAKATGTSTGAASLSGAGSVEIGGVESHGLDASKSNGAAADDAILRAQGHTAAMPRLFSIVSTMGLMFWCVISTLCSTITVS